MKFRNWRPKGRCSFSLRELSFYGTVDQADARETRMRDEWPFPRDFFGSFREDVQAWIFMIRTWVPRGGTGLWLSLE